MQPIKEKGKQHVLESLADVRQHRVMKDGSLNIRRANDVLTTQRRTTSKDKINAEMGTLQDNMEVLRRATSVIRKAHAPSRMSRM